MIAGTLPRVVTIWLEILSVVHYRWYRRKGLCNTLSTNLINIQYECTGHRWSLFPSPCAGSTSSTMRYNYVFSSSIEEPTPGDGRLLRCLIRGTIYVVVVIWGNDRIVVIWGNDRIVVLPYHVVARSLCASSIDDNYAYIRWTIWGQVIRADIWWYLADQKQSTRCRRVVIKATIIRCIGKYSRIYRNGGVEGGVRTIEPIAGWRRHMDVNKSVSIAIIAKNKQFVDIGKK